LSQFSASFSQQSWYFFVSNLEKLLPIEKRNSFEFKLLFQGRKTFVSSALFLQHPLFPPAVFKKHPAVYSAKRVPANIIPLGFLLF
jgi:hypothetical protein